MDYTVYGHQAIVRRRNRSGQYVEVKIRRKGKRAVVERAARLVCGFCEIVDVERYAKEEWERVFGVGRM